MAYDIGPRIGIKGEAEFNNQIKKINNSIRECGSEMKALSSEFEDNANSQDALIAKNKNLQKEFDLQKQKMSLLQNQYDKQVSKLNELAQAYQKAKTENGELSTEATKAENAFNKQAETVTKLKVSINETQSYMNKLDNAMSKNDKTLDEIASGARDASGELKDLGDSADQASDQLGEIASSTKAEALQSAADGIASLGDAMMGVVEDSKEYLSIMGQLEASSEFLGYSAEETEQTYTQLYGVLGDTQTAATATANLQAIGLSQQDLTEMTELAIGAWARYGDSIPIDSLAEGINETIQAGEVTGTFADALNWAGISEDEFNEKLATASSESERAQMVMEVLKSQGLDQVAQGFRDENGALIELNEAQDKYNEATAKLGEQIMPMVSNAIEIAAGAIGGLADWLSSLPEPVKEIITVLGMLTIAIGAIVPPILMCAAALAALNIPLLPLIAIIAAVIAIIAAVILVIQNWGDITAWIEEKIQSARESIEEAWNSIKQAWNSVQEAIQVGADKIGGAIDSIVGTIKSGYQSIKSGAAGIGASVKSGFQTAIDFIRSLPANALQWGRDFIQGLRDGIMSGVNSIVSAVKSVANKIRSFLHFSRPDEGPLREYEKWMPDFMTGLADGIYENIDKVQKAAAAVSGTIDSTITGRVADMASNTPAMGGGTIIIDGDTLTIDGKVIGKTAVKYITNVQTGALTAKGAKYV